VKRRLPLVLVQGDPLALGSRALELPLLLSQELSLRLSLLPLSLLDDLPLLGLDLGPAEEGEPEDHGEGAKGQTLKLHLGNEGGFIKEAQ
jgi:hypothetical protein